MVLLQALHKYAVAAFISLATTCPSLAQDATSLDDLFAVLRNAEPRDAGRAERDVYTALSQSGSDAMDLLLERGRAALEAGDTVAAIGHFTALVDHAPDFAEGYNGRATAYFLSGRYGPAIADIRHTLDLEPRHFGALSGLAVIMEELGYPQAALEALREIAAIHPNRDGLQGAIDRLELALGGTAL